MQRVYIVKTREKKLFITINMAINARRVDDGVRRRRNDDKTMGTAQFAG
jgi:hypothetical protein